MLGHRGARESAPENSQRAFALALDEGADGVELDVRLDGDGRVIVLHDAELARVSHGSETRAAEELGAAELARVDLGGGERVPLLVDVLRAFRERGARVNVELKRDVRRPSALLGGVERAVRESGAPPELVIFSS
ncbi:MAG TPA: glycerophosphodiester phosphodiesterase family protein, partial [Polyangiaceae bacterium]|nr:glycerophosphodiester phosphodiesterase family protein [Polyangiaceae bacterium]